MWIDYHHSATNHKQIVVVTVLIWIKNCVWAWINMNPETYLPLATWIDRNDDDISIESTIAVLEAADKHVRCVVLSNSLND